mmetsp:Transcript_16850/g.37341  ORF Transcript_16850/g.37341 Transcript_16850/m.37341 type:complete len:82 (-) Transcript_16850:54-299(-)
MAACRDRTDRVDELLLDARGRLHRTHAHQRVHLAASLRRDFFDERVRIGADLTESADDDPADRLDGVELGLDRADAGVRAV